MTAVYAIHDFSRAKQADKPPKNLSNHGPTDGSPDRQTDPQTDPRSAKIHRSDRQMRDLTLSFRIQLDSKRVWPTSARCPKNMRKKKKRHIDLGTLGLLHKAIKNALIEIDGISSP